MEDDLSMLCDEITQALQDVLQEWSLALDDASRSGEEDPVRLYSLYPKIASHLAWSRGNLTNVKDWSAKLDAASNGEDVSGACEPDYASSGYASSAADALSAAKTRRGRASDQSAGDGDDTSNTTAKRKR